MADNINLVNYEGNNIYALKNRKIEYIVIHYTGSFDSNEGQAANVALNTFDKGGDGNSADFIVDDKVSLMYNPDIKNYYCQHAGKQHHAGTGGQLWGKCTNQNSIGIEVCSTSSKKTGAYPEGNDPCWSFTDAVVNRALNLTKYLMQQYNIDASHVVRHWDVANKLCPGIIGWNPDSGNDSKWQAFKKKLGSSSGGNSTWISIIKDVKAQIAKAHMGYKMGGNVLKVTSNGYTRTLTTDCTGFISICVSCYAKKDFYADSSAFMAGTPDSELESAGFTKMSWSGWDSLLQGDIIVRQGHGEIFCKNENGKHYVWNCGSDKDCNSTEPSTDSGDYSIVWRVEGAGGVYTDSSSNGYEMTEEQKNQIIEAIDEEIKRLGEMGIKAERDGKGGLKVDFSQTIQDYVKYHNIHKLKGIQHPPADMKRKNFKQDYVVIIRKKLCFTATMESEENYLRMYQINNFFSIATNHTIKGEPATCTVQLKGGERVVCVNKIDEGEKNWQDWEHILYGFTNIDDEGETNGQKWRIGTEDWDNPNASGIDYKNLMKAKEAKYGWRFAEKCDWEPMDEIMVFSKSKNPNDRAENGQYKFIKIFFGFIESVKHDFNQQGNIITISAKDQLKLLNQSWVNQSASYFPGVLNEGKLDVRFNLGKTGMFTIFEPYTYGLNKDGNDQEVIKRMMSLQEWFSGIYPDYIIKDCCLAAGIPARYLNKRIEPVKVIPYIARLNNKQPDLSTAASFKKRLDYCKEVADKCLMEFFCDEEGNIVFKIPNYVLGVNQLTPNNLDLSDIKDMKKGIDTKYDKSYSASIEYIRAKCKLITPIIYTCTETDTMNSIAKKYFGDTKYAPNIKYLNLGSLQNYTYTQKLKKMDLLILQYDVNNAEARQEYRNIVDDSDTANLSLRLYEKNSGKNLNTTGKDGVLTQSMITDVFIPEILPEDIVKFSICDSDQDIYTSISVDTESFMDVGNNEVFHNLKRTIPDLEAIMRFGVRPAPNVTATYLQDEQSVEEFGHLKLVQSYAQRYTGTLQIIEDPSIKIGNPIRLLTFDEHTQPETGFFGTVDTNPSQNVYYVTAISRSINISSVSTMTLTLVAGRMMGQESCYDIMSTLYAKWFTEPDDIDKIELQDSLFNWSKGQGGGENNNTNSDSLASGTNAPITDGTEKIVPSEYGDEYSQMAWQMITGNSKQKTLRETVYPKFTNNATQEQIDQCGAFNERGYGMIENCYCVAVRPIVASVGDFIDIYVEKNGQQTGVMHCIVAEVKGEDANNLWGHNGGRCVIEFVNDAAKWYAKGDGRGYGKLDAEISGPTNEKMKGTPEYNLLKGTRVAKIKILSNYFKNHNIKV